MTDHVLEVRELSKDYGDFVLDKVSFTPPRGVIMGLIGENGAGKSTTINCILNETQKTGGEIRIFGKDHKVLVKDRNKAAKQYSNAIVGPATIEEIMLFYVKGEMQ